MKLIAGLIGGLVAMLVGAAVWAAISYYTGYELGFIAWGIGVLVGLGVSLGISRLGGGEGAPGVVAGVLAVVLALGGIALGKFVTVHFVVERELASRNHTVTESSAVLRLVIELASRQEAQGKTIKWPNDKPREERLAKADFPADMWASVETVWNGYPEDQRRSIVDELQKEYDKSRRARAGQAKAAIFTSSFGAFDLLWVVFAAWSAFKIGSKGS
ncbi:MAG: hypothetical protein MUE97_07480 [Phycisphaerales bacterium]|nr:hypothetical protein [Phycisphaerales bacterium]